MNRTHEKFQEFNGKLLIAAGMMLLAFEPVQWLVNSWRDPAYDSDGFFVFAACVVLFLWSMTSNAVAVSPRDRNRAFLLLGLTAAVRAAGQVFAVHVIGAMALVIDVYAIGLLAGLKGRGRAVSPFFLAMLFGFSLPLERILQRVGGYMLQNISASGACATLKTFFHDTSCEGMRILVNGHDVLVDLPCSGARILVLVLILYAARMAVMRPAPVQAVMLGVAAVMSAVAANTLRIILLALGTGFPEKIGGIDVMAQPWHDSIGLVCLALAALPLLFTTKSAETAPRRTPAAAPFNLKPVYYVFFALAAVVIVSLPHRPIDVATTMQPLNLSSYIGGEYGTPVELTAREQAYFTQYGGMAVKSRYGDSSVMVVRTSSPLRHLHSPDECLRGMGFDVHYVGVRFEPVPTALYTATAPDGKQWRIAVTFYSNNNVMTTNVSEAVWRWMQDKATWQAVQRITPLDLPDSAARKWDDAVFTALDIQPQKNKKLEIAYADHF